MLGMGREMSRLRGEKKRGRVLGIEMLEERSRLVEGIIDNAILYLNVFRRVKLKFMIEPAARQGRGL